MLYNRILCLLLLFVSLSLCAQTKFDIRDTTILASYVSFHGAIQLPAGDMEERFGNNANVGVSFGVKNRKNWIASVEAGLIFGNDVKEPFLMQNLFTDGDEIIDDEGRVAEIILQQRGYTVLANLGKIFPVFGPNPNSGMLVKAGIGFVQHKIRIEHEFSEISALEEEYEKGYDRLTNGLALQQFIGYFNMSSSRLTNFYVGIEFVEGFTQGRRSINFDTQEVDDESRIDILYGIRAGWMIPIYRRRADNVYYY